MLFCNFSIFTYFNIIHMEELPRSKKHKNGRRKRQQVKFNNEKQDKTNWEKFGVWVALSALAASVMFSGVQSCQTRKQLQQGDSTLALTQKALSESQRQFAYVIEKDRKQDSANTQEALEEGARFKATITNLIEQAKASTRNNELITANGAPDIRVFFKNDTVSERRYYRQGSYLTYLNIGRIYLDNKGGRTAEIINPQVYQLFPDTSIQKYRSIILFSNSLKDLVGSPQMKLMPIHSLRNIAIPPSKVGLQEIPLSLLAQFVIGSERSAGYYKSVRDYQLGQVIFVLIRFDTKDNLTKKVEKQYFAFDMIRNDESFLFNISPMPLSRQRELIDYVRR